MPLPVDRKLRTATSVHAAFSKLYTAVQCWEGQRSMLAEMQEFKFAMKCSTEHVGLRRPSACAGGQDLDAKWGHEDKREVGTAIRMFNVLRNSILSGRARRPLGWSRFLRNGFWQAPWHSRRIRLSTVAG